MADPSVVTVGVDGYSRGWVAAVREGSVSYVATFPNIVSLVAAFPGDAVIVIDIPIGHPDRILGRGRIAEQSASKFLTARVSSVFPMPARAVVEEFGVGVSGMANILAAHRKASELARLLSTPSRGLSIQGFSILPKILEVDRLLVAEVALSHRIVESHPEIAFAVLGQSGEMRHPKKSAAGQAERKRVLLDRGLPAPLVEDRLSGIPEDDRIDALAMLLVADRVASGDAYPLPDPPGRDTYGLPIAIWV